MSSFLVASLHSGSFQVEDAQIELGSSEAGHCSSQIPLCRFGGILLPVGADLIKISKVGLSYWITSIRGYVIPMHRFIHVFGHTLPEFERESHPELRFGISRKRLPIQCRQLVIELLRG